MHDVRDGRGEVQGNARRPAVGGADPILQGFDDRGRVEVGAHGHPDHDGSLPGAHHFVDQRAVAQAPRAVDDPQHASAGDRLWHQKAHIARQVREGVIEHGLEFVTGHECNVAEAKRGHGGTHGDTETGCVLDARAVEQGGRPRLAGEQLVEGDGR